jgi:hypothetical protein
MLNIHTFDQRQGGNVLYKALAHPLAAEAIAALAAELAAAGPIAIFDPEAIAPVLFALHPALPTIEGVYVQDVAQVGADRGGHIARPLTDLRESRAATILVAAFDTERLMERLPALAPAGARLLSLDQIRLAPAMLTNPRRYLDRLNFATNYAFFRDQAGLSTTLVTANYWSRYGATDVRLWLRLYDGAGQVLAEWEEAVAANAAAIKLDSRALRARFALPAFAGQLFIHAIGVAGHDVVKYALDTYETDGPSLSCTHDANAWPADRYAGLPAPRPGEHVTLWVQNSHAVPIPAGALALDRMGADRPVPVAQEIPAYASVPVDVGAVLPGVHWPAQVEIRAGRHVVRPRYEITEAGRTRIAHPNVERADLRPDPGIKSLSNLLGRGYLLPFPILPRARFRTELQPTPMANGQTTLPLRLDIFDPAGTLVAAHFLGCLPRAHAIAPDLDSLLPPDALPDGGHGELVYDFRDGGEADGWMHALIRATDRASGHAAETSFGAHIYNTPMTYRDEPQSYAGPPPGLTTRLFLRLGDDARRGYAVLIYPASARWHAHSCTHLLLHSGTGAQVAEHVVRIACSGSLLLRPETVFNDSECAAAGPDGYMIVRDATCRLFGYHGLMDRRGGFSLDHMFGF